MSAATYSISDVADELKRAPHTVRLWEKRPDFPPDLIPARDERGWRWYTAEQVEGLKQWLIDADIRPGKALRWRMRQKQAQTQ